MHFIEVNEKIYDLIKKLAKNNKISLQKLYLEIRKQKILTRRSTIREHIKDLEDMGKIKVINWVVILNEQER